MVKREYELEEVEAKWLDLPWWMKVKIVITVTWYTWEAQLAEGWLKWVTGNYQWHCGNSGGGVILG